MLKQNNMFYDILNDKRKDTLSLFRDFKNDFYLAGGTALALQIGHRDSVDFDFFTKKDIRTEDLFDRLKEIFKDHKILKIQEEKNTLTVLADSDIKISFFTYKYELLNDLIDEENFRLASIEDIACMKLSAICSRASNKDYIDLYYILKNIQLDTLLQKASKKFPDVDISLIIKSLVFFDDILIEPIIFKHDNFVDMPEIKKFMENKVKGISF